MSTPTLNEQPKAPRGMAGASLVRAAESRTPRGALLAIREWWNRRKGSNARPGSMRFSSSRPTRRPRA